MVLEKNFDSTNVIDFPRHRLRMISKLAEGAFGTVSWLNILFRSSICCTATCIMLCVLCKSPAIAPSMVL